MKVKLKARFLPPSYLQDNYSQLHNLVEGDMSVDEYTTESEKLLIKCDIQEPEEQTIVRYLRGFEPRYSNVVELQQYSTFSEVCVLAHKVEQQKRRNPPRREFPRPQARTAPFNKGSSNQPPRSTAVQPPLQTRTQN